jgi:hypothetical protein
VPILNEDDLRDCFAMFAMVGLLMRSSSHPVVAIPQEAYQYADAMLEARKHKEKDDEEDVGIARVAKRTYRRKS